MNQNKSTNTPKIDILDIAEDPTMFLAISMSLLGSVLKGNGGYPTSMLHGESKIARNHIGQGVYFFKTDDFNHLYKKLGLSEYTDMGYLFNAGGDKLSDIPFRQGGMFHGFKDQQYCNLIAYPELLKGKRAFGTHVIVDTKGQIVLSQDKNMLDHPYFHKGVIASIKGTYYNLLTGKPIVYGNSSTLRSENYLFVENCYNFCGHENYEQGVYKIEWATGNFEVIK